MGVNYEIAFKVAKEKLRTGKPEDMSAKSKIDYRNGHFTIPFLGSEYIVDFPNGDVWKAGSKEEISVVIKILLLHYLIEASGMPVQHRLISFKELPNGFIYVDPFTKRAINPFVSFFGQFPEKLKIATELLGGRISRLGDICVTIPVLPLIPLTFVLWIGDEEFPPSGNILFDASAPFYLPTEDYAVLAGLAVYELKRIAKEAL